MFVILLDEYFDEMETPSYSNVIGYFTTYENAENYMLEHGYRKVTYSSVDLVTGEPCDESEYTNKNEDDLAYTIARILELELIK